MGVRVRAATKITEQEFNGAKEWVHAERGEEGVAHQITDGDWATVTWLRTGTTYDTRLSDLEMVPA